MDEPFRSIENAELIERIFGSWPSFHDAEIHHLAMTRDGSESPRLDVTIHHWMMTEEIDPRGHYVLKHHTLSTLRFSGVTGLRMEDFNHQNVLRELEIVESTDPLAE